MGRLPRKTVSEAAQEMMQNPAALELRRLQMLTEIGAENNTTTLVMIPSDLVSLAKEWTTAAHNTNMATLAANQVTPPNHQLNSSSSPQVNLAAPVDAIPQQLSSAQE